MGSNPFARIYKPITSVTLVDNYIIMYYYIIMSTALLSPAPEVLLSHPYVLSHSEDDIPRHLISEYGFERAVASTTELLEEHEHEPIEALVGDDVSGRVPTLIAHNLFRLALAGDHAVSVPRTYFMTSGQVFLNGWEGQNDVIWRWNLSKHAQHIVQAGALKKVMLVTDTIHQGTSMRRLRQAFTNQGVTPRVHEGRYGPWLRSENDLENHRLEASRQQVGVEKYPPEAVSRRHPDFEGSKTATLRRFLLDYSGVVYSTIFNEEAPQLT